MQIKEKLNINRGETKLVSHFLETQIVKRKRGEEKRKRKKKKKSKGMDSSKELCMELYGTMILYGKVMGVSLSQT